MAYSLYAFNGCLGVRFMDQNTACRKLEIMMDQVFQGIVLSENHLPHILENYPTQAKVAAETLRDIPEKCIQDFTPENLMNMMDLYMDAYHKLECNLSENLRHDVLDYMDLLRKSILMTSSCEKN